MYKAKYKAISDDASGAFYKAHAQKMRNKRRIEKCEIQNVNGEKITITNPVDIAGHFTKTYEKLFNTKHKSSKEMLVDFMGKDIDKLGKITNIERDNLAADISYEEMQDCIEEMRLSAQGGPDGLTSRLLKVIASRLPNLVHGAMIDITRGAEKPKLLADRFLIFIDKPESVKLCYK